MMRILAISGSLRVKSSNSALLRAASHFSPKNVEIISCQSIKNLPLFNPDLEQNAPFAVKDFRNQFQAADGILIASPEYAHGVTGAIKNALDWITSSGELVNKPVALLNASPRATIAYEALKETISVMMGRLINEASVTVPLPNNEIDEAGIIADPQLSAILQAAILTFIEILKKQP